MNIGVFTNHTNPQLGGGFTFESSLIEALTTVPTSHTFHLLYYGKKNPDQSGELPVHALTYPRRDPIQKLNRIKQLALNHWFYERPTPNDTNPLEAAIQEHHLDLVWFVRPRHAYVTAPYITTVWDLEHRLQPYFPELSHSGWIYEHREPYFDTILKRASFIITGTQAGKEQIQSLYGIPPDRIRLLPHPTPPFALSAPKTVTAPTFANQFGKTFLYYPAQFWAHKNHVGALHALKLVNKKRSEPIHLVFSGSDKGNLTHVKKVAHELGLNAVVHFLGFIETEEMIWLYRNALALLYPSFFGPENLPPLEAFALGCPVLYSDFPGAQEQLGNAALYFNPQDEKTIAATILKLDNNPKLRTELIQIGNKRATRFTTTDFIKGILAIADEFEAIRRCWE